MMMAIYLLTLQCSVQGWFHERHFHQKENYQYRCVSGENACTKVEAFSTRGGNLEGGGGRPSQQSDHRRVQPPPPPPPITQQEVNHTNEKDEEAPSTNSSGSASNSTPHRLPLQVAIDGNASDVGRRDVSNARLNYEAKYYRGKGIEMSPRRLNEQRYNDEETEQTHIPTVSQQTPMPPLPMQPPAIYEEMRKFRGNNSTVVDRIDVQKGRDTDVAANDPNLNDKSFTSHHKQDMLSGMNTNDEFDVPLNIDVNNDDIKADAKGTIGANHISDFASNATFDKESRSQEVQAELENRKHIEKIAEVDDFPENTPKNDDNFAGNDEDYDVLETAAQDYSSAADGDNQDAAALSKLQRSVLMKSKKPVCEKSSTKSISSWLMQNMSNVGKRLIKTAVSSIWTKSYQDKSNVDSLIPILATTHTKMKLPRGLGSEVLIRHDQVIQLSILGNPPDVIWKIEENSLDHAMELFTMYFDLWNIKCPKRRFKGDLISKVVSNTTSTRDHESNTPIPFQPSTIGTPISHAESILVSTFLSNAVSSTILNDSIMNTILPAVYSHMENYTPPPQPIRTKREKTVITKTTRVKPTILSKIDTDENLDDIDFARLLMELEGGPNEQIIEEIEYEYDEEPVFIDADDVYEVEDYDVDVIPEVKIDDLNDEELYEDENELSGSEVENDTDYDDLLDDDELEVLEDARIDSSDWFSGDDDQGVL